MDAALLGPGHRRRPLAWLTGFTLANVVLAILVAARNIPFAELGAPAPLLFLGLAMSGHFLFFGGLLGLPAWIVGRVLRSARWLTVVAVLLQTLWLALLLADSKVFALYRFHLNGMVANMLFGGALQEQVTFSPRMWATLAAAGAALLAVQIALAWGCWRLLWRWPGLVAVRRAGWVALAIMVAGQAMAAYYDARGERAMLRQLVYIPWAKPITLKRALHRFGVTGAGAAERPPEVGGGALRYPLRPLQCAARPRYNLLIVVVESLRHDMLAPRTMPLTWAYARDAWRFDRHYSAGNATRFGLFGLMYGLPGGYWHAMLAEQRGPVLIDRLRQAGYDMRLYGSAPLYSPEFDRTVFSAVRDRIVNAPKGPNGALRDRYVIDRLRQDLHRQPRERRFFGFVFLDSPHAPYHLPPGYAAPFQPMAQEVNFLRLGPEHDPTPEFNRYRAAVRYSDELIGMLLRTLEETALADDTIVAITGDHGEEFNDLGLNYWGHNGNFSDWQLRTPLVLRWPGRPPQAVARITSHEDLVPTLMRHAFGCTNDSGDYSTGHDLFAPGPQRRPLLVESWSQRGIRDGGRTYLFDSFGSASVVGPDYRPIDDARPDPAVIASAWEMLTRYQGGAAGRAQGGSEEQRDPAKAASR
ncbi:DUF3413 domain-containing protein [Vulcaniibacterium tengchongense]|uniref:Uncharacterized protein n=1 Tax=Vulcaniibacterium tengchongense TaxID=1273429 RepID=A0A3N4W855_9GAMM|nr:sulfatase-like hydrolase/transferase [Vulcaniibacterium tengchongense]RPE81404.1 hypothetical protein EDC50_0592 [Vulcaniibacterium tengchongense]